MILLRIPPLLRGKNFSNNPILPPLLVGLLSDFNGDALLLVVVVEDARPILRAGVGALAVGGGGVVHFVEVFD